MKIDEQILANPVLREVQNLLENQTAKGLAKYGTTVNIDDYSLVEWIDHAIEEAMDMIVYYNCIIKKLIESGIKEIDLIVQLFKSEASEMAYKVDFLVNFRKKQLESVEQ
ncbi:hypothetical protein FOH38_02085 [Lysinibacillus fusiformis]|nr:hypothetical protein FOH38_02085 [Lysinibacillus fusiformis]